MLRAGAAFQIAVLALGCCLGCSHGSREISGTASPTSLRNYDVQSYELVARFDWTRRRLIASERLSLLLPSAASGIVELDSAVEVNRVHAGDRALVYSSNETASTLRVDISPLRVNSGELAAGSTLISFTIEYEAPASLGLTAATARDGDPVGTRVVYTYSEPFFGKYWLVGNHVPADRATWAVELSVAADEDMVANGVRTQDNLSGGERVIRYQLDQPIPTYTMAFAAGQLEHQERAASVPLSVWYRRGLMLEPNQTLDPIADELPIFEQLLGPYPWDAYSVVLLPDFPGGMENTTSTFVDETWGQANPNVLLGAHELSHQWFGDWVTVQSFDDLWIKEGMATLLEHEAERAARDVEGRGSLFGTSYAFSPADSIRDKHLVGLDKYTSGPYRRAAWLLSQIRARVGEAAFWQSLRDVLAVHALGTIGSEAFVRAFALDETSVQRILLALDEKRVPVLGITTEPSDTGTRLSLTLNDPGQTLVAPLSVTVVDAEGNATLSTLASDETLEVSVPAGGYLAPDESGLHPDWWKSFSVAEDPARIAPLFIPGSAPALAAFLTRSAAHQEHALDFGLAFDFAPAALGDFYAGLDSFAARRSAELDACSTLKSRPGEDWDAALTPILEAPSALYEWDGYAACGTELPNRSFAAELNDLVSRVNATTASRLAYLMSFDYGAASSLDILGQVASSAPSLQLREQALLRLSAQAAPSGGYSALPASETARFKEFFRARLAETTSANHFRIIWRAIVGLADDAALSAAGRALQSLGLPDDFARQVVCDAYAIARVRPDAWAEFQSSAQPWDNLGAEARAVLADPSRCSAVP